MPFFFWSRNNLIILSASRIKNSLKQAKLIICLIRFLNLFSFSTGVSRDLLCNNGTCEDFGNSHLCICNEGYTGSYCAIELNECDSAPCLNGATCTDLVGSYLCSCTKGFQGQNCELNVDDCKPNPCQNGGTCHDLVSGFSCSCPPGM